MTASSHLSVTEAAKTCRVSQGTVKYWIRTGKLPAVRQGRGYHVPRADLNHFLRTQGRDIPPELAGDDPPGVTGFRPFQSCSQYWKARLGDDNCRQCPISANPSAACFAMRVQRRQCHGQRCCHDCAYYQEFFSPRIGFVHQMRVPAAVAMDLFLVGGNGPLADLIGLNVRDLAGMGVERLFDSQGLAGVLEGIRNRPLAGDRIIHVTTRLLTVAGLSLPVRLSESALNAPPDAFLMVFDTQVSENKQLS